jgi:hypothetical protein
MCADREDIVDAGGRPIAEVPEAIPDSKRPVFRNELVVLLNGYGKLREFARHVLMTSSWGVDIDGGDAQDKAEELGLIAAHIATEDDVNEYSDFGVGDTFYKFTEVLNE